MSVEDVVLKSGIEIVGAVFMGLTGWVFKGHNDRINKVETEQEAVQKDIAEHKVDAERYKLEAEQRFAKDVMVQATLSRLHERIDEISVDTKAILRKCEENNCVRK